MSRKRRPTKINDAASRMPLTPTTSTIRLLLPDCRTNQAVLFAMYLINLSLLFGKKRGYLRITVDDSSLLSSLVEVQRLFAVFL